MLRISTAGLNASSLAAILKQQSTLAKTQSQLTSGNRILQASDDPLGSARLQRLGRTSAQIAQYTTNANAATTRLNLEEQATSDSYNVLQQARDLALQASNVSTTVPDRADLATELAALIDQLRGIANRQDATGEHLFAGYASMTTPFATSSTGTTYAGDHGQRLLQIDDSNFVADTDPGSEVFMNITQGNGSFVTAAAAANTGSGVIDPGSVTDKPAFVSDAYTISFTTATDWQVTDSGGNVVSTGTYTSGDAIAFNGAQVSISGTPAAGDSYSVTPATREDVFTTLQKLLTTLQSSPDTAAGRAQLGSQLNQSLTQIDQAMNHISSVRSSVGTRLNLIDTTLSAQGARSIDVQAESDSISKVDYTAAATQLSQQLLGLQAAQQSYASVSKLSLFNYL